MSGADRETYSVALRVAAKLMALKALKMRRSNRNDAENWLQYASFADYLAEEYERGQPS